MGVAKVAMDRIELVVQEERGGWSYSATQYLPSDPEGVPIADSFVLYPTEQEARAAGREATERACQDADDPQGAIATIVEVRA